MNKKIFLIFSVLLNFVSNELFGQGCSDAGVCTMGSIGQYSPLIISVDSVAEKTPRHAIQVAQSFGIGETKTKIFTTSLDVKLGLTKTTNLSLKLPFSIHSGTLAQTMGMGDITLSVTQQVLKDKKLRAFLNAGVKIPTGNSDLVYITPLDEERPLPMVYQPTLGSTDLLLGLSMEYNTWQWALAYQHPFTRNNNGYESATSLIDEPYYKNFNSRKLLRQPDFVARVQKFFPIKKKLLLDFGILGIYHTRNDIVEIGNCPPGVNCFANIYKDQEIKNSEGLTINVTTGLDYLISRKCALHLDYGMPLIVRENRPDGLTRKFVGTIGLEYKF